MWLRAAWWVSLQDSKTIRLTSSHRTQPGCIRKVRKYDSCKQKGLLTQKWKQQGLYIGQENKISRSVNISLIIGNFNDETYHNPFESTLPCNKRPVEIKRLSELPSFCLSGHILEANKAYTYRYTPTKPWVSLTRTSVGVMSNVRLGIIHRKHRDIPKDNATCSGEFQSGIFR